MLNKLLIGIAAVVCVMVLVIATRASTFHVERSITIAAPAERAFAQVNDFHAWSGWSPYEKLAPEVRTFEGPASGAGAVYAWAGGQAGEGKMTIAKSDRPSQIAINLQFIKPMAATNTATFTFAPAPEGTKVTWAMDGESSFMWKAASLVMDMDKLIGSDFERGLADLKSVSERPSTAKAESN
jgi:carbon monoxide dehydrogenase subunit G